MPEWPAPQEHRPPHRRWHGAVSREQACMRRVPAEGAVPSQHTKPKDSAQHLRACARRGTYCMRNTCLRAVPTSAEEGGAALCPPQTHHEAGPAAATRHKRSARRVLDGSSGSKPAQNGSLANTGSCMRAARAADAPEACRNRDRSHRGACHPELAANEFSTESVEGGPPVGFFTSLIREHRSSPASGGEPRFREVERGARCVTLLSR